MMHEGRKKRASQNKYSYQIDKLQKVHDEKKMFLQNCIDPMT